MITQHMPPGFTKSYATRLNSLCRIRVAEASDGERVLPGHAYIAPGGMHLSVERSGANYIVARGARRRAGQPPQALVEVLFESAARVVGRNALGVMLTGMGADGAKGDAQPCATPAAGTCVQDEASCVVFGMPREAIAHGATHEVLPLTQIAPRLIEWLRSQRRMRRATAAPAGTARRRHRPAQLRPRLGADRLRPVRGRTRLVLELRQFWGRLGGGQQGRQVGQCLQGLADQLAIDRRIADHPAQADLGLPVRRAGRRQRQLGLLHALAGLQQFAGATAVDRHHVGQRIDQAGHAPDVLPVDLFLHPVPLGVQRQHHGAQGQLLALRQPGQARRLRQLQPPVQQRLLAATIPEQPAQGQGRAGLGRLRGVGAAQACGLAAHPGPQRQLPLRGGACLLGVERHRLGQQARGRLTPAMRQRRLHDSRQAEAGRRRVGCGLHGRRVLVDAARRALRRRRNRRDRLCLRRRGDPGTQQQGPGRPPGQQPGGPPPARASPRTRHQTSRKASPLRNQGRSR
jgi:hypothetical protein